MNRTAVTVAALLAIGTMVWIGGQFASAAQPKTDPCLHYYEEAKRRLTGGITSWDPEASIANSLLYQNCRDLERQR
jgi:hypothetical protein